MDILPPATAWLMLSASATLSIAALAALTALLTLAFCAFFSAVVKVLSLSMACFTSFAAV